MTDNEIRKAEKVIKNLHAYCFCSQSVFKKMGYNFTEADFDYLYNLSYIIKKQNAEIERLEKKANTPFAEVTFDENKLKEIVADAIKNIEFNLNSVKSEAIKEFAEQVKMTFYYEFDELIPSIMADKIDNLVKEMTEENNNFEEV